MARIRSVHPGLFSDEHFVGLSDSAQIFFVGLWTEADDYGAFEWKPVTLKIKLRGASTMPVEPLLEELKAADRIRQYTHNGRQYGVIRNFTRFQRPKFPKSAHFIPDNLRSFVGSTEPITEIGGVDEPPLPRNAENPPQMEDEGGKEERTDASASVERAGRADPSREPINGSKPGRKLKSQLPAEWWPDERDCQYAAEKGHDERSANEQAERFRNHHTAHDSRFADWHAAWRTWVQRAPDFAPRSNGSAKRSAVDNLHVGAALAVQAVIERDRAAANRLVGEPADVPLLDRE